MGKIPDGSMDMILCDLPYGITAQNKWDEMIDPDALWREYERVIKNNGTIVCRTHQSSDLDGKKSSRSFRRERMWWRAVGFFWEVREAKDGRRDVQLLQRQI